MDETTAAMTDAYWVDRKAASMVAPWVDQMGALSAAHSAARSAVCLVASMDETTAVTTDAYWAEQKVVSTDAP
jgi:hypothetical protein